MAGLSTRSPSLWCKALLASLVVGIGCNHPISRPEDALKAYVAALKQGDHKRAYSLLSKELRQRCTLYQFVSNVRQQGAKSLRQIEPLLTNPRNITYRAHLKLSEHDRFVLVKENGVWRIASDPLNFYSQKTPREALVSFVRALERRRYQVLLRFVPNKWRHTMTTADVKKLYSGSNEEKTRTLLRNLKANLDNRIEVKSGKAVMLYGENHQVQMIKEDGVWKILEFE